MQAEQVKEALNDGVLVLVWTLNVSRENKFRKVVAVDGNKVKFENPRGGLLSGSLEDTFCLEGEIEVPDSPIWHARLRNALEIK